VARHGRGGWPHVLYSLFDGPFQGEEQCRRLCASSFFVLVRNVVAFLYSLYSLHVHGAVFVGSVLCQITHTTNALLLYLPTYYIYILNNNTLKVVTAKMGMLYGIAGMIALIAAYWADVTYTYDEGLWLIAASMAPGAVFGLWSGYAVAMTGLPEMVGAYNGFGGLAASLTGIGLYLDPDAIYLIRGGDRVAQQTSAMLWVQGIALILSIVIGTMTFTGSFVAVLKLHETISSRPVVVPCRSMVSLFMIAAMTAVGALAFCFEPGWNNRVEGLACICIVTFLSGVYGIIAVMVRTYCIFCIDFFID
jgi:NAD/NADP transhydrogenase beta subunit